jgi:alpha-ribazole phosphatase
MDVYLVRHTTPDVAVGVCYGQADVGLADSFDAEWLALSPKLEHLANPLVFSSPLQRCAKLAQRAADHFNFSPAFTDTRLLELNFGDWELEPWRDIPQGIVSEWTDEHVKQAPPNGESYVDLHQRAKAFLYDLAKFQNNKQALVFTHAGVIRALVAEALNLPLREASRVELNYGSVTHITVDAGVTRLEFVNR